MEVIKQDKKCKIWWKKSNKMEDIKQDGGYKKDGGYKQDGEYKTRWRI